MHSMRSTGSFYHPNLRELATMMTRYIVDVEELPTFDIHNILSCSETDMLSYLSHKEALKLVKINSKHIRF